jgi:uncharacterized protein (TIGR00369 family)
MDRNNHESLADLQADIDLAPFHGFLRPKVEALNPEAGTVTITLAVRPDMGRVPGEPAAHGGIVASLADLTAHAAVRARVGHSVPTVDLRLDYLRPANGARLSATATILKCGQTLAIVDVTITTDAGKTAAVARATFLTTGPTGNAKPRRQGSAQ